MQYTFSLIKELIMQGLHCEFEPEKAHSTEVGIICPPPPCLDRVNCNPNCRQGPGLGSLNSRGAHSANFDEKVHKPKSKS